MSFFKKLQPSIIRFSSDDCIPESLKNKYAININVIGIDWFQENFLETEDGGLVLLETSTIIDSFKLVLEGPSNVFDVPRIYVVINDSIVENDDNIYQLVYKGISGPSIYGEGFDGFRPGVDYYINDTLYSWLTRTTDEHQNKIDPIIEENNDIFLPNLLDGDGNLSHHFIELDESDQDYTNLSYYKKKNDILGYSFTEDELYDFTSTFCGIILDNSEVQDAADTDNQVYKLVLEYWRNHQSDCASIALALILGTKYTTSTNTITTCNSCFNTSSTSTDTSIDKSCYEKYQDAMAEWLKHMLGDSGFYEDWFFLVRGDCEVPNDDMIDILIDLINSLLGTGWNLGSDTTKRLSCNCPDLDTSYDDTCNRNILLNYIKVLEWVKADKITSNKNKIKVYGQQFGELLTKLNI